MTGKKYLWMIIATLSIILITFVLVSICRFALVCAKSIIRLYQKMKQNGEITLTNKKFLLVTFSILFIILIVFALVWSHVNNVKLRKAQKQEELVGQMPILLAYIEGHNGEVFDYDFVSANLGIPRQQIFKLLTQLKQEGKIVNRQQYLRHAILLSDNDYMNFYWRVYISSDKHPLPEAGDSFPEEPNNP